MNWNDYFYNQFPKQIQEFASTRENIDCPHHQIPKHLACFVNEDRKYKFPSEFFMAWFGLTMIDQVLHRYFPDAFEKWKAKFGEHPIPMRGPGMGCITWDHPILLIEQYVNLNTEEMVLRFNNFF